MDFLNFILLLIFCSSAYQEKKFLKWTRRKEYTVNIYKLGISILQMIKNRLQKNLGSWLLVFLVDQLCDYQNKETKGKNNQHYQPYLEFVAAANYSSKTSLQCRYLRYHKAKIPSTTRLKRQGTSTCSKPSKITCNTISKITCSKPKLLVTPLIPTNLDLLLFFCFFVFFFIDKRKHYIRKGHQNSNPKRYTPITTIQLGLLKEHSSKLKLLKPNFRLELTIDLTWLTSITSSNQVLKHLEKNP